MRCTGRGEADDIRPARWTLPSPARWALRVHPPHAARARHLQVLSPLLAPQTHRELLEEPLHDVLESGEKWSFDQDLNVFISILHFNIWYLGTRIS